MTEQEEILKLLNSGLVHLRADVKRAYFSLNGKTSTCFKIIYEHIIENLSELNEYTIKLIENEKRGKGSITNTADAASNQEDRWNNIKTTEQGKKHEI